MVESLPQTLNLKVKILEELENNPCFNYDMSDVNWAIIGSFNSFKEIFESHEIDDNFKTCLVTSGFEIIEIIEGNNDLQRTKNIWFYKYLFTLFMTNPNKEIYTIIKKEFIESIISICRKDNEEGISKTFTVRKISFGVGVEKIFPVHSPSIEKIEVTRKGKVRRAKLNYLRDRVGKAAKVKEAK